MNNENKDQSLEANRVEQQRTLSPEEIVAKRDKLFGIKPYSADDLTRIVIVERSPSTPDGKTWPDSDWLVTGEGLHPKTGDVVAKLEKLIYDESGNMMYDHEGKALVDVKYQPLDDVMKYDAEQREKHAVENERSDASSKPLAFEVSPQSDNLNSAEKVRPSADNPIRFGTEDAISVINYHTGDGEARGAVIGYYLNEQDERVDLVKRLGQPGEAFQGEAAVLNGNIITSGEDNEYDRLFDPNHESNYSVEDAAVRMPESEGERLTRERRVRDAKDAANKAYLRYKDGSSY